MQYSELPHASYIENGIGPGALFLGDEERWNWRYSFMGTKINEGYDHGVVTYFNDAQREIMRQTPAFALTLLKSVLTQAVTPEVEQRLLEAQARLFPQPKAVVYDFKSGRKIA